MKRELKRGSTESPDMFHNLLASRPRRERRATAAATFVSAAFHVVVVGAAVWATLALAKGSEEEDEQVHMVELQEEPPELPPPPPPPREVTPPPAEVPDVPRGFQTLTLPEVLPPDIPPVGSLEIKESDFTGEGVEGGRGEGKVVTDIDAAPTITPYTLAPEMKNRQEMIRALQRLYPPTLRDAGISGSVVVWVLIDENGKVLKTQVNKKSGYAAFDEAALRVAALMQFTPAMNMDRRVKVWVSIPISFTSK